jgi:hypothetical protein
LNISIAEEIAIQIRDQYAHALVAAYVQGNIGWKSIVTGYTICKPMIELGI